MKKILITAALPYSNGCLHVGHIAGCYLPADTYVRFKRLQGHDVRFVCGSDDHGVAIMLTAEKEGTTPGEVAKKYGALQAADFEGLGIHFDVFGSTSQNPHHAKMSQDFFTRVFEQGFFEKKANMQFYDEKKEVFLPDRFVKGVCSFCSAVDQNGDQCENCGKVLDTETLLDAISVFSGEKAVVKETVHWFLDLSKFEEEVSKWIDSATIREHTRKYVKGLLGLGLVKRSMTRDIPWGIPLPLEDPDAKGKVLYVWFDAPIGYISNTQQLLLDGGETAESYLDWWAGDDSDVYHFIGEDNTIFHCIIWIAILAAEGSVKLPKGVIVNQFLNIKFPDKEEEKISKSRGTAVWIADFLKSGIDRDVLRYYLTTIAPEKARTVYNPEDLLQRNNTDLANTLGNFVNRVLSFSKKHYGDSILEVVAGGMDEDDTTFRNKQQEVFNSVTKRLDAFEFRSALEEIMGYVRDCNRYIDDKAPWKTRKEDEERTKLTLALCMESIHFIGVVLQPYMPGVSEKMLSMILGEKTTSREWDRALTPPSSGVMLGEVELLFTKHELAKDSE